MGLTGQRCLPWSLRPWVGSLECVVGGENHLSELSSDPHTRTMSIVLRHKYQMKTISRKKGVVVGEKEGTRRQGGLWPFSRPGPGHVQGEVFYMFYILLGQLPPSVIKMTTWQETILEKAVLGPNAATLRWWKGLGKQPGRLATDGPHHTSCTPLVASLVWRDHAHYQPDKG